MKILVADDARDIADVIGFGARMTWPSCAVLIAEDGQQALNLFAEHPLDLVVLDLSMPPPDGFEVCRCIRETSRVPILVLTVRDSTLDKVRALDLGADDYLTKPFDHVELLARLRALARRSGERQASAHVQPPAYTIGDFTLDGLIHAARVGDRIIPLTSTEYRLLEELVSNAGHILPHRLLLARIWGEEYIGETRYLKVFVGRLRKKLGDDSDHPRYIQTEWGLGYRFVAAP